MDAAEDSEPICPTVAEYLAFVTQHGCKVDYGTASNFNRVVRITAPSGRHVVIYALMDDQQLTPSVVSHFDRRLGLDSPFLKLPGTGPAEN